MSDIQRVLMLSMHTSPLDQPGNADAGGMNVYIIRLAEQLAAAGVEVDIATRGGTPVVDAAEGVRVLHVSGPFDGLDKHALITEVDSFAAAVRTHPAIAERYDALHGHYWLSGLAGLQLRDSLGVPLVQSMHTLARVKDAHRPPQQPLEPAARIAGEEKLAAAADWTVANADDEAAALIAEYGAPADRVSVVHPGVDLRRFVPGSRDRARAAVGVGDEPLLVLAGRMHPLKGLDVLLEALTSVRQVPGLEATRLAVVGGFAPDYATWARKLIGRLGLTDAVRLVPPASQDEVAQWYRAADAVTVPSYSESFGFVALEAQATGTPVIATRVGGLTTAVENGVSGVLVDGHEPGRWAKVITSVLADHACRKRLAAGARPQAERFSWERAATELIEVYAEARARSAGRFSR